MVEKLLSTTSPNTRLLLYGLVVFALHGRNYLLEKIEAIKKAIFEKKEKTMKMPAYGTLEIILVVLYAPFFFIVDLSEVVSFRVWRFFSKNKRMRKYMMDMGLNSDKSWALF